MLSNSQEQKMISDTKISWKTEQEKNNPFLESRGVIPSHSITPLDPTAVEEKGRTWTFLFSSFKTLIAKNQHDRNTIIILCKSHTQD